MCKTATSNMRTRAYLVSGAILGLAGLGFAQDFRPEIPRVWDDRKLSASRRRWPSGDRSPRYMTAEEYYALKVRPIYRSYPVYAPGREPAGYRESLLQRDPEIIFDASKLRTKARLDSGRQAGLRIARLFSDRRRKRRRSTRYCQCRAKASFPPFRPGGQYFVRKKGVLEVGGNACADCHTRVMPDGSFFQGGQGVTKPAGCGGRR